MNEQWNNALDQVEDEFLMEAARYRRKRHWPGVVAAAAAVLVLAVGWWIFKPQTPTEPTLGGFTGSAIPTSNPPEQLAPDSAPGGFTEGPRGGHDNSSPDNGTATIDPPASMSPDGDRGEHYGSPSEGTEQEPPMTQTLHFATYADLRTACLDRNRWYLHRYVMVPFLNGQPLEIEDITVFEAEMYNEPWVWYFITHQPHITVRIPTLPALTATLAPDTSGAEALRQIWPDAPNLHNRDAYTDSYSEIREVTITTSEGEKNALFRQEIDRDRAYLTFLQNGTLVTVAGPRNALEGDWLESFTLTPIDAF